MKVIGITGNYASEENTAPRCYLMADSSVLFTGRPFFVPDFARGFVACPAIVVRTGRLGKCIAPKFASRYWDALTAGFTVRAVDSDDELLEGLDRAFDGSAIVGDWVTTSSIDEPLNTSLVFMVNGETVSQCCLADLVHPVNNLLVAISTRCSIKMGDMIFTGDAGPGCTLQPGDRLTATMADRQILDVKVRL